MPISWKREKKTQEHAGHAITYNHAFFALSMRWSQVRVQSNFEGWKGLLFLQSAFLKNESSKTKTVIFALNPASLPTLLRCENVCHKLTFINKYHSIYSYTLYQHVWSIYLKSIGKNIYIVSNYVGGCMNKAAREWGFSTVFHSPRTALVYWEMRMNNCFVFIFHRQNGFANVIARFM